MIHYNKNVFYNDSSPLLLLSGEIHYFRLDQEDWEKHLLILKETACNTVATYIPWVYHQEVENELDLTGSTNPRKDIVSFLELCQKHDIFVILRPGPYIMAEMKNEGLPYWLFEKYPDIKARTWQGDLVPNPVVDFHHKGFLDEVQKWYQALYNAVYPYLQQNGGPIIGIQLDNEVGMLSWVSNAPELTSEILDQLNEVFPDLIDSRLPLEKDSLQYRQTVIDLMRQKYGRYIQTLQEFFVSFGATDLLYFINIHGTSANRAKTFPIGIQQLINTYSNNDIIAGSDVYLSNLDLETAHDLYIINEMLESTSKDKPMTSLEFNTSDGNFGDNLHMRILPSAADFKIRLSISQNQRLLNYYLLSAGINDRFAHHSHIDGNDRIAITGERHGFAAPVQVDGSKLYTYERLQRTTIMLKNLSSVLASMQHLPDEIYVGFNPDDYATEYTFHDSASWKDINEHLSFHRQATIWDTVLKQILLNQYHFQMLLLDKDIQLSPKDHPIFIYNTCKYMSLFMQEQLVTYHKEGGRLLLVGEYPELDMLGHPCTVLIDYLEVKPQTMYYDWEYPLLSLESDYPIKGSSEFRSFYAQSCVTPHSPLFREYQSKESVGFKADRIVYITSNYPGDLAFTKHLLSLLDAKQALEIHSDNAMLTSSIQGNQDGRFIHILNLDHMDHQLSIHYHDQLLFDKPVEVFSQEALMIPLHVRLFDYEIIKSTAELFNYTKDSITLRLSQASDTIVLRSPRKVQVSPDYTVTNVGSHQVIQSNLHGKLHSYLTVSFQRV